MAASTSPDPNDPPGAASASGPSVDVDPAGTAPGDPSIEPEVGPDGSLRLLELDGAPPDTFGALEPGSPPLIDGQGRVRLSFSRIDSYDNCPRKFRYAYIDRLPSVPSPHLSFGTSVHGALEAFYDRKLPSCPSEEELLGFLFEHWDTSGFAAMPREEQLEYYRHAQDVMRRFHRRAAPDYRLPAATEAWFSLPIGHEAVVVGSIDRVDVDDDGRFHIIDYKTNHLGPQWADYAPPALEAAVAHGQYHLQYLIYGVALHRHLGRTLPDYDPAAHLGGVHDLFLRGMNGVDARTGVHSDRLDPALITALDRLLDGREAAA